MQIKSNELLERQGELIKYNNEQAAKVADLDKSLEQAKTCKDQSEVQIKELLESQLKSRIENTAKLKDLEEQYDIKIKLLEENERIAMGTILRYGKELAGIKTETTKNKTNTSST